MLVGFHEVPENDFGRVNVCGTEHLLQLAAAIAYGLLVAGATAIFPANPFERRLRDALTASQQVQGRIDHYATVGRHLLGLPPDSSLFL